MEKCEDSLSKSPQIMYTSIFSYFLDVVATDSEMMKSGKSVIHQYFHSDKVDGVISKRHNILYLGASQSLVSDIIGWVFM